MNRPGHSAGWRRGRDSNPRYSLRPYDALAKRCLQPLGHLSGASLMHLIAWAGQFGSVCFRSNIPNDFRQPRVSAPIPRSPGRLRPYRMSVPRTLVPPGPHPLGQRSATVTGAIHPVERLCRFYDSGRSEPRMCVSRRTRHQTGNPGANGTAKKISAITICCRRRAITSACYLCNTRRKTHSIGPLRSVLLLCVQGRSVIVIERRRGASRGRPV